MKSDLISRIELFHLLFLSFFVRKTDRQSFALKGGCNLRFFFNSPRYSEDMDMDVQGMPVHVLQDKVNALLASVPFSQTLAVHNITVEHVTQHKQSETTQRWKFGLLTPEAEMPCPTKIEFSRRGMFHEAVNETIHPEILQQYRLTPFMVPHYSAETACLQKIEALAVRSVTQARDIFDLHILLTRNRIQNIRGRMDPGLVVQARENILNLSFDHFKGQVLAYLDRDMQSQYNAAKVWERIQWELLELLENDR